MSFKYIPVLKLSLYPYQLRFKFPFRIAHGVRDTTDVVYVKLEHEGHVGWGEAALPPYLPETQRTVIDFLTGFDIKAFSEDINPPVISKKLDEWYPGNMAAKAALDIALWNLKAAMENKTISDMLGIDMQTPALCTYTLGIGPFEEMSVKVADALLNGFQLFKIKLDGESDSEMINNFRKLTDKPFIVDVNQGWKTVDEAIEKSEWLKALGCLFAEQPMPTNKLEEMKILKQKSALAVYADESCHRLSDIEKLADCFDGINIKLMKCGGISEAFAMVKKGRELGLKILIGCMSESSVGCNAAAQLTGLANCADLDGPYLISNDPFRGIEIANGRVVPTRLEKVKDVN